MAIGAPDNKQVLDAVMAAAVRNLREAFAEVVRVNSRLAARTEASLVALGYTSGEVAVAKSAFTELTQARNLAYGQATLNQAKDHFVFGEQLTGWQ